MGLAPTPEGGHFENVHFVTISVRWCPLALNFNTERTESAENHGAARESRDRGYATAVQAREPPRKNFGAV